MHGLRGTKRLGEHDLWVIRDYGGALAVWLNSDVPSQLQARSEIADTICEMNDLDAEYKLVRKAYEAWVETPNESTADTLDEAKTHVRPDLLFRLFHRLAPQPVLAPDARPFDKWQIQWRYNDLPGGLIGEVAQSFRLGMDADRAVQCFLHLAERGLLGRMRQCVQCRKWLCAKRDWQRFCSDTCREVAFRTTTEGRRKRREYMRRYRSNLKRMEQNALKAARQRRPRVSL